MLIVSVAINNNIIDKLYIHRMESFNNDPDYEYSYEILNWDGNKRIDNIIKCKYGDYKPLVRKCLSALEKSELPLS